LGDNEKEKNVGEALDQLYLTKVKIESAEQILDAAKKEYHIAEETAIRLMLDAEILSAATENASFKIERTSKFWVLVENKQSFIEWAKATPHAKGIIKEDFHFKTLNSWAKECVEKGIQIPETVKSGQVIELNVRIKSCKQFPKPEHESWIKKLHLK